MGQGFFLPDRVHRPVRSNFDSNERVFGECVLVVAGEQFAAFACSEFFVELLDEDLAAGSFQAKAGIVKKKQIAVKKIDLLASIIITSGY